MTANLEQLCTELLALSQKDRAEVAQVLLESLGKPPSLFDEGDPAFVEELIRREENIRSGKAVGVPAEEVFARLDERLTQRSR